jgi:hypothetical protein
MKTAKTYETLYGKVEARSVFALIPANDGAYDKIYGW